MVKWLSELPWAVVVFGCLTLGLAPFKPPHLFEKLQMLAHGELRRPLDWFDLALHASPWLVAAAKALVLARKP